MSELILRDQKLWFAGHDLTGSMNALALDHSAELVGNTAFGDDTRSRLGGLKDVTAQHEGYWDGATIDQALFDQVALADIPMSFAARDAVEGGPAYSFLAVQGEYSPGASVGEMLEFSLGAEGSGVLVRGSLLANRAAESAGGNAPAFNLGAVAAGQNLYAALHVTAVDDPADTLDVRLESDDASGFATPTTRITFAQASAIGAEWAAPIPGPLADTWWRIAWTIAGTTPAFTFAAVVAIQ